MPSIHKHELGQSQDRVKSQYEVYHNSPESKVVNNYTWN